MRTKKPDEEPFEIMLIPMIDCLLVIIIFFLVATTLKNRAKELPLEFISRVVRIYRIVEGPSEVHRWVMARDLLKNGLPF